MGPEGGNAEKCGGVAPSRTRRLMATFYPTVCAAAAHDEGRGVLTSARGRRLLTPRAACVPNRRIPMAGKIVLVVPEAPAPAFDAVIKERAIDKRGIRLGVLDNSKGNAD